MNNPVYIVQAVASKYVVLKIRKRNTKQAVALPSGHYNSLKQEARVISTYERLKGIHAQMEDIANFISTIQLPEIILQHVA